MDKVLDVSYIVGANDRFRCFDLHVPPQAAEDSPMIVFVHGGAWRSEDKSDYQDLARQLAAASSYPVLVPNYRLTPNAPTADNQFRHPGHAEDVLRFLDFITSGTWNGIPGKFSPAGRGMYLLGHSAGAHILSSIFLDSSAVFPSLTPSDAVLRAARGLAMSEGIYDVDLLLARFPAYREWFIASVFGDRESYPDASTTRLSLRKPEAEKSDLRWLIIHSTGDTLVDQPQSDAMYVHLRALYGDAADAHVARNVDQLDVEHNDVLKAPQFVEIIPHRSRTHPAAMAPIYSSSSAYPSPAAFFEPSPTSTSATVSHVFSAVYAGAAQIDEANPSPVPSIVHQISDSAPGPDPGLHQFIIWMAILGACALLYAAYILGKDYVISKWRSMNTIEDDEEEKRLPAGAAFSPPMIAIPPRSATLHRSDPWSARYQPRPFYISQADMLRSGRGFFG
ncbi:putative kynurenine formamidase [Mycena venus]|uniref:Putative kynurenine formamidase n=1 Tax=Mycena venus TaxID=2733690 RepID=A0A8H6XD65_9AGAR|nr:putative kynurenine formamidase [Mycena venus]